MRVYCALCVFQHAWSCAWLPVWVCLSVCVSRVVFIVCVRVLLLVGDIILSDFFFFHSVLILRRLFFGPFILITHYYSDDLVDFEIGWWRVCFLSAMTKNRGVNP